MADVVFAESMQAIVDSGMVALIPASNAVNASSSDIALWSVTVISILIIRSIASILSFTRRVFDRRTRRDVLTLSCEALRSGAMRNGAERRGAARIAALRQLFQRLQHLSRCHGKRVFHLGALHGDSLNLSGLRDFSQ